MTTIRTVILGLGNPIMSDDSVGIVVAREVAERLGILADIPNDGPVEIRQAFAGGIRLVDELVGFDRAIIIDAVVTGSEPVGTTYRQSITDDLFTRNTTSLHDTDLPTALTLMRLGGEKVPDDIIIYGVEAACVFECGTKLTPAVARAVPELVEAVILSLQNLAMENII